MAMAKKKSSTPPVIGYGTNIKRGKAVAKTTAAKVRNRVAAAGGAKTQKVLNPYFNETVADRREIARARKVNAASKMAKAMNKKRG